MTTRREILLGMAAGGAGLAWAAKRTFALTVEDMPPDVEAALNAACGARAESHAGLIAAGRLDLLQRIARGLLLPGASERVACPVCGCDFIISADDAP